VCRLRRSATSRSSAEQTYKGCLQLCGPGAKSSTHSKTIICMIPILAGSRPFDQRNYKAPRVPAPCLTTGPFSLHIAFCAITRCLLQYTALAVRNEAGQKMGLPVLSPCMLAELQPLPFHDVGRTLRENDSAISLPS
jgi:hypothetical protein